MYADIASGSSGGSARISPKISARARSAETRDASDPSPVAIRHNSDLTSTAVGTWPERDSHTGCGEFVLAAFVQLTSPSTASSSAASATRFNAPSRAEAGSDSCPLRSPFRAVRRRLPDLIFPFAGARSPEVCVISLADSLFRPAGFLGNVHSCLSYVKELMFPLIVFDFVRRSHPACQASTRTARNCSVPIGSNRPPIVNHLVVYCVQRPTYIRSTFP